MSAARETAAEREARMTRAAAGRAEAKPPPVAAPPVAGTRRPQVVRTKPVRTTVDMAPALHRKLKRWTAEAADELELADVPIAEVVRALVRRLTEDGELSDAVLDDLRRTL